MPDAPIIRQISTLKGLGVFANYSATAEVPDLQKRNLIYGFNSSGKTTLSRVLASLEAGSVRPELPGGGEFSIDLTDGSTLKSTGTLEGVTERVLVFNVDFVQDNLRWSEGTASPVFYLGRDQAELSKKLEQVQTNLAELQPKWTEAERTRSQSEKTFTEYKRDTARSIERQLKVSRGYNAATLAADYTGGIYEKDCLLDDTQQEELQAIIGQDAPLDKCATFDNQGFGLKEIVHRTEKLLRTTLGTVMLEELQKHPTMLKWVGDGLAYHVEHDLKTCLFCGNSFTKDREEALRVVLDQRYTELTDEIDSTIKDAKDIVQRFTSTKSSFPSPNDISTDLRQGYMTAGSHVTEAMNAATEVVETLLELLLEKSNAPNLEVASTSLPPVDEAQTLDDTIKTHLSGLNMFITGHNARHDQFDEAQSAARTKLKKHLLAEQQSRYTELQSELSSAVTEHEALDTRHKELTEEIGQTKQQLRQHGSAAERINRMLHSYLGHNELQIDSSESGYQITRNGEGVNGSLSEGEKTAIALCYFISTLDAEGRKLKDLIVVIDDPISSLDTRALHYAFSMIKGALQGAGQLVLLTHNLHFMNEAKKWLKQQEREGKATLLFLDAMQSADASQRSSSIRVMPKLIRDYESEYQYLFHLALQFVENHDERAKYFYLMPNVLRKILEIFLAFRIPGPEGLANKIDNIVSTEDALDSARVHALDRLTQLESHADNLDDLVTFSSMTIEETVDAAEALMHLMSTVDQEHYRRLRRICG